MNWKQRKKWEFKLLIYDYIVPLYVWITLRYVHHMRSSALICILWIKEQIKRIILNDFSSEFFLLSFTIYNLHQLNKFTMFIASGLCGFLYYTLLVFIQSFIHSFKLISIIVKYVLRWCTFIHNIYVRRKWCYTANRLNWEWNKGIRELTDQTFMTLTPTQHRKWESRRPEWKEP